MHTPGTHPGRMQLISKRKLPDVLIQGLGDGILGTIAD